MPSFTKMKKCRSCGTTYNGRFSCPSCGDLLFWYVLFSGEGKPVREDSVQGDIVLDRPEPIVDPPPSYFQGGESGGGGVSGSWSSSSDSSSDCSSSSSCDCSSSCGGCE